MASVISSVNLIRPCYFKVIERAFGNWNQSGYFNPPGVVDLAQGFAI